VNDYVNQFKPPGFIPKFQAEVSSAISGGFGAGGAARYMRVLRDKPDAPGCCGLARYRESARNILIVRKCAIAPRKLDSRDGGEDCSILHGL
jgi:hypothetical protein